MSLSIALLGPLTVTRAGAPVDGFRYAKARALLAYLAVEADRAHARTHLATLLWPDAPDAAARQSLSQALSTLRSALGDREPAAAGRPPHLLTTTETVRLNPDRAVEVDVTRFVALLDAADAHPHRSWRTCAACEGRLRAALALYRGDLLEQFPTPEAEPFEDWARQLGDRLRQRALAALERLAQRAEWRGDLAAAVAWTRRALALEPFAEAAHRELMRLLALDGQPAVAEAHFAQLRRLLDEELGVEPEPATIALRDRILSAQPGQLRRHAAPPDTLPGPPGPLIGRADDLRRLGALLDAAPGRLVTLIGPPGVGKTRLALAAAAARRHDFEAGVRLIELAPLADAALAPAVVARAVGVRERAGEPPLDALLAALRELHALLVLDNCEHLPGLAPFVAALLAAGPTLRVLATSREPLQIRAEQRFALAPLALPAAGAGRAAVARAPAVRLLTARARAARPDFGVTENNAPALAAICARLDGLPLAIELVAFRVAIGAAESVLAELEARRLAGADGPRDLPARQRTLRAAITWSWALLSAPERALLSRLAVFVGGWPLAATATVCGADDIAASDVPVVLEGLVGKSLVQRDEAGGEARDRLLETVRQYAAERLAEAGEPVVVAARERHLDWCLALAEAATPALAGPQQQAWAARLERDHDNLRAALRWSVGEARRPAAGLRLAVALWRFWRLRGHLSEGRGWLERALAAAGDAPIATRAAATLGAGYLAHRHGDYAPAGTLFDESHALAGEAGDQRGLAGALNGLGLVAWSTGDYGRAQDAFAASLDRWQALGDVPGAAVALGNQGNVAKSRGDYRRAEGLYEAALAGLRAAGDRYNLAIALGNLGIAVGHRGDHAREAALHRESLALFRALGDTTGIAMALGNLGMAVYVLGDAGQALALLEESLALFRELGDRQGLTGALADLGNLAYHRGEFGRAEDLHRESLRLAREVGNQQSVAIALLNLGRTLRRRGDAEAALARHREGLALAREIGDEGLVASGLERAAAVIAARGGPAPAARLLSAAERLRDRLGAPLWGSEPAEHDDTVRAVGALLGEPAFAAAWAAGRVLPTEQAVALALAWGPDPSPAENA